jgi:glycosyltransferase involved in cell wall biosynthesis
MIPNPLLDPTVFYAPLSRPPIQGRTIKIVASSSRSVHNKGQGQGSLDDTLLWLDSHLDGSRFELVYMGDENENEDGISAQSGLEEPSRNNRLQILPLGNSESLADFLRSGDIYLALPSYPASNVVMEALACGLPVLYPEETSMYGAWVGDAGRGFASTDELLPALERLVEHYDRHVQGIHVPSIQDVSKQYLSIMRWCFYMKHLML